MSSLHRLIFISSLAGSLVIADSPVVTASVQHISISPDAIAGYSALKLFLEDEQHLTTIRRVKIVINFSDISEQSIKLVDNIADSSAQAAEELEKLSTVKPDFKFENFPDESIAKSTIDSLRMTTFKEFMFDGDDFEKDLLLSQLKVLPMISHLAKQLEEKETNSKRKKWLNKLADQYENYYQKVNARILISSKNIK